MKEEFTDYLLVLVKRHIHKRPRLKKELRNGE
jgi:hypothetical protein